MQDPILTELHLAGGAAKLQQRPASLWAVHLKRTFAATPAELWPWITQPDRLVLWSPVVPDRPLDTPGTAHAREDDGAPVVACDVVQVQEHRLLRHRWGRDTLSWGLTAADGGTELSLEVEVDTVNGGAAVGAGWDVCLATLACLLRGDDVRRVVGDDAMSYGWEQLRDVYLASWEQPPTD